jgi:DNA-binding NarL/FixJ family response regulator
MIQINAITVLLIDDNPSFLRITARLLEEQTDGALIVRAAGGVADTLAQMRAVHPHVLLLGLSLSSQAALGALPSLRATMPAVGIIALGLLDTPNYQNAVLEAGADAFVPKVDLSTSLLPTIWQVVRAVQRRSSYVFAQHPTLNGTSDKTGG